MITETTIRLIWLLVGLFSLWYAYFFLYREYTIESFRTKMFILRNELFDSAANGAISFEHPAYILLRNTMNGFIRFGHRVSLFELVMSYFFLKKNLRNTFSEKLKSALKDTTPESKQVFEDSTKKMVEYLAVQAILASPFFVVFIIASKIPSFIMNRADAYIVNKLKKQIDTIETAALAYGEQPTLAIN